MLKKPTMNQVAIYDVFGTSVNTQAAMRSDGRWFTRTQYRDGYGLHWNKWRQIPAKPDRAYINEYNGLARLPKIEQAA